MSTQPQAMQIPANLVKELRERTGAGFSDCRAALVESGADIEKAIDILRKFGVEAPINQRVVDIALDIEKGVLEASPNNALAFIDFGAKGGDGSWAPHS